MHETTTKRHALSLGLVLLAAGALASPSAVAAGIHGTEAGDPAKAQRRVIRQATERFRDVGAAIAAGYLATDHCVELPGVGGMGFHYVHPGFASDMNIDPTLPEILVYAPTRQGELRLVAVEYLKADADGDPDTDEDRPTLFGEPFEGPMEGHEPGMPVHYDLHAWVWKHNPAGELSAWNPDVTCQPAT